MTIRTLTVDDLAEVLQMKRVTVEQYVTRHPERLPPRLHIPGGRRVLWLEEDVLAWLRRCRTKPRRPGRPRNNPEEAAAKETK